MVLCCVRIMAGKHVDLNDIRSSYSDGILIKGEKENFRRAYKKFSLVNGQMIYEGNNLVIIDDQRQREIIHKVYKGLMIMLRRLRYRRS